MKTRKTRSDYGTERPLTKQERHVRRGLEFLNKSRGYSDAAHEQFVLADAISPTTDNRKDVKKRAKKRAR